MGEPREFAAAAETYDRFMGRFTRTLAPALIEVAGIGPGDAPVLDVGCGPGGLATALADVLGDGARVAAIDPAEQFVAACRDRVPGADARVGVAEALPWGDGVFGAALSSLVVGFMDDPAQGIAEMSRVTRPGGTVAACMWDIPAGMTMLRHFWQALHEVRPDHPPERALFGTKAGEISGAMRATGLQDVREGQLTSTGDYSGFDDYWESLTHGIGPIGQALAALPDGDREQVRRTAAAGLPNGPFQLEARAWYAVGVR